MLKLSFNTVFASALLSAGAMASDEALSADKNPFVPYKLRGVHSSTNIDDEGRTLSGPLVLEATEVGTTQVKDLENGNPHGEPLRNVIPDSNTSNKVSFDQSAELGRLENSLVADHALADHTGEDFSVFLDDEGEYPFHSVGKGRNLQFLPPREICLNYSYTYEYDGTVYEYFDYCYYDNTCYYNPSVQCDYYGISSPTDNPTESPTESPTDNPTESPTESPTDNPTESPTESPTDNPTESPTESPTDNPTESPTESPTDNPTERPTENPLCTNNADQFLLSRQLSCSQVSDAPLRISNDLCNNLDGNIKNNCPQACGGGIADVDDAASFQFTLETSCTGILSSDVSKKTIAILCNLFGLAENCPQFCPATGICPCVDSIVPFRIGQTFTSCAEVDGSEEKEDQCKRTKTKRKCPGVCAVPRCV